VACLTAFQCVRTSAALVDASAAFATTASFAGSSSGSGTGTDSSADSST